MQLMDARELSGAALRGDVCVVGAGVAGLVLAEELSGTGLRVIVLESGDLAEGDADDLNEIVSVGAPRVGDQRLVRNRVLGGTSSTWSGRVGCLDEIDLSRRSWVPGSGWPLERGELDAYYARSCRYLGVSRASYVDEVPAAAHRLFDGGPLRDYAWGLSSDRPRMGHSVRFGPRARSQQLPGVLCVLNATVSDLRLSPDRGSMCGVEVTSPAGARRRVEAPVVVLSAGGIENARILLASRRQIPGGVGNSRDQVGRHLMDHPRGSVGVFRTQDLSRIQAVFSAYRLRRAGRTERVTPGMALSARTQQEGSLLNCAAWINWEVSEHDPYAAAANVARLRNPIRHATVAARQLPLVARGAVSLVAGHRSPERLLTQASLQCIVEQAPDPDSRITLSERVDRLGTPLSVIDWRVGELERATVARMAELVVSELTRLGLPAPVLDPQVFTGTLKFPDRAHPAGATRMSDDPAEGVVDRNAEVHDVRGLYIAGSSIFPTSGHINPTQTIVALTIRLADHLRASGRRSTVDRAQRAR